MPAVLVRMQPFQLASNPVHLSRGLFHRHARPPARDHLKRVNGPPEALRRIEGQRHEHFRIRRPPEPRGEHADDFVGPCVQQDRSSDDLRIGAEADPPQRVGQNRHPRAIGILLLAAERAARGRDPQRFEKSGRDRQRAHALRLAVPRQVQR